MLYAILNGEKIEAVPNTHAKCQLCERDVFSKCGEIKVWHWAHKADKSCDGWYEPETEWHKHWKLIFGKENSEIRIEKDGVKHIADIFTKNDVVIELQNSPIQKPIIRRREQFYGEKMLWVINGLRFKENFQIYEELQNKDWLDDYILSSSGWIDKQTGNPVRISDVQKSVVQKQKQTKFSWSRSRRSWEDAIRPIFIDFGDEDLFWAKSGLRTNFGTGKKISKEKFIEKYGGDVNLLPSVIKKMP
ncbi:MAG TPA: competence protein CoiA family protein [Chitinophagaceae bacterium]|nr:competence protein CoiA family protein [Chitinophagaceae bacterium]